MKYLRRLEGKTRKDRTITDFFKWAQQKRNLKWYGHLIKMNNERKIKQVYEVRPQGRSQGRTRNLER